MVIPSNDFPTETLESDFMSPAEFAKRAGMSPGHIYVLIAEGRLPVRAVKIGRIWRIPRESYDEWKTSANDVPAMSPT